MEEPPPYHALPPEALTTAYAEVRDRVEPPPYEEGMDADLWLADFGRMAADVFEEGEKLKRERRQAAAGETASGATE